MPSTEVTLKRKDKIIEYAMQRIPKTVIAKRLNVSREYVYQVLRRHKVHVPGQSWDDKIID